MFVKQFGLERSGTNICKALVEMNFGVRVLNNFPVNKHSPVPRVMRLKPVEKYDLSFFDLDEFDYNEIKKQIVSRTLYHLFAIRPIESWIEAFYRHASQMKNSKYHSFNHDFLVDALSMWRESNLSYLNFVEKSFEVSQVVNHAEVLKGDVAWLEEFSRKTKIPLPDHIVSTLDGYAKKGTDKHRGADVVRRNVEFDRGYQLQGKYVENIPEWAREFIDSWKMDVYEKYSQLRPYMSYS